MRENWDGIRIIEKKVGEREKKNRYDFDVPIAFHLV